MTSTNIDMYEALGKNDFQEATCLSISEVEIILRKAQHEAGMHGAPDLHPIFQSSFQYVQRFRKFNDAVEEMRRASKDDGISDVEFAMLANLCPKTAEEACELVPTLTRMDQHILGKILSDFQSYRDTTDME